jgi:hypothetical protein
MMKLNAPYRSGPSKSWIKVKNPKAPAANAGCRWDVLTRMTTHTDEMIASAVVLACLLIALFAILLAAPLLFVLMHMGAACCAIDGP